MKVLIPDDDRGHWESLRRSLDQESELQISGAAADAETASHSVIARELRRILDGCPICDGGYRDHAYALLATLAMEKGGQSATRLKQFYGLLRQYLWRGERERGVWGKRVEVGGGRFLKKKKQVSSVTH